MAQGMPFRPAEAEGLLRRGIAAAVMPGAGAGIPGKARPARPARFRCAGAALRKGRAAASLFCLGAKNAADGLQTLRRQTQKGCGPAAASLFAFLFGFALSRLPAALKKHCPYRAFPAFLLSEGISPCLRVFPGLEGARRVYSFSIASSSPSQRTAEASDGIRQSLRGDSETEPVLGPSGIQERLNWLRKKRV